MTRRAVAAVLPLLCAIALAPGAARAQEYSERFALAFGGFQPTGEAPLGFLVSFNYGGRVSDSLRVGGEFSWYRRTYESSFLLVDDPAAGTGTRLGSVATTQLFPIMGTADYYFPFRGGDMEFFIGGGVGLDLMRVKHYPDAYLGSFTRNAAGFGYVARVGLSSRPGRTVGAVFLEAFYKGSSIGAEKDLVAGRGADVDTRSKGVGFRVGFRF